MEVPKEKKGLGTWGSFLGLRSMLPSRWIWMDRDNDKPRFVAFSGASMSMPYLLWMIKGCRLPTMATTWWLLNGSRWFLGHNLFWKDGSAYHFGSSYAFILNYSFYSLGCLLVILCSSHLALILYYLPLLLEVPFREFTILNFSLHWVPRLALLP